MDRRQAIKLAIRGGVALGALGGLGLWGRYTLLPPSSSTLLDSVEALAVRLYDSLDATTRDRACATATQPSASGGLPPRDDDIIGRSADPPGRLLRGVGLTHHEDPVPSPDAGLERGFKTVRPFFDWSFTDHESIVPFPSRRPSPAQTA